ncbi:hypothetical protein GJV85_12590 [Sulfurimonas aquatica]|uniref:Translocation and assembly module TamB C-terminal domain-containing protein n=1 Tax=Sulfurimonas aquatica TaxID=2672570 RepID=A0A975GE13_9BACT|nr:translocation/assembly module TamB domain-containing protein [Sulfurimonas aquatica]QSZ42909.1 hypothetical protein GJV85_12590 [Sulfurimonas aquatica]
MISYLYLLYRNIILFFITIFILLGVLLINKEVVPYLAQKYAGEYGLKYSKVEGTLFFGITVKELEYKDFLKAKSLTVRYDFFSLLALSPKISKITSDSLYLNADKLPTSDSNESGVSTPAFSIKTLLLKNVQIMYNKELYGFDVNATKIEYEESLSVKKMALDFRSSYGDVLLNGYINSNTLYSDSVISVNSSISKKYLSFLQTPPKRLNCMLEADTKGAKLSTKLKSLKLKEREELELKEIALELNYSFKEQKLNGDFRYKLYYERFILQAKQKLLLGLNGNFNSTINAEVKETPFVLPFKEINARASGSPKKIAVSLDANKLRYKFTSDDYKKFFIEGEAKDFELSFVKELPELLQKDVISFKNSAMLQLSPLSLSAKLEVDSLYYVLATNATWQDGNISAFYTLNPKRENALFEGYPLEKFSPLKGNYIANGVDERVKIKANLLEMKLLKKGESITGDGKLASNRFTLATRIDKEKPMALSLDMKVTSLKNMLIAFEMSDTSLSDISDIMLDINSSVVLSEPFIVKSSLYVPSIAYKADMQTTHLLNDIRAKITFSEDILTLHSYDLKYKEHSVYSNKSSKISLKKSSEILFKEFWIFDNILLAGSYKTKKKSGDFTLKGDKVHYKDKEFDVTLKMDLSASFDANATKVAGGVTLLDGNISYMPKSDYTINDSDIIIIQDIKKKNKGSDMLMDIKVDSTSDIRYIHENATIFFHPDLRVIKTATKDTHVEGKVFISKGELSLSDKKFLVDKSELYFDGNMPINPKLNLNLHYYTLDYIDIHIYVTHTLEEPVFIFSSNPALSQNDIMSYILFGESANSMFNSSGDTSKTSLLLGTGMKELFNKNSTVQIDTLNILTKSDGSIGYEVGSRLSKDMRIVYKNDTVSSVILQYNLGKSTRVDVDVRQTGQGVSLIYLKDFQ